MPLFTFGMATASSASSWILNLGRSLWAALPAQGLLLPGWHCWQYFGTPEYLRVAKASALLFYEQFVRKGYTPVARRNLARPDSESAFACWSRGSIVRVTGEADWLERAREQAHQCFTWCVRMILSSHPINLRQARDADHRIGVCQRAKNTALQVSAPFQVIRCSNFFRATGDKRYSS